MMEFETLHSVLMVAADFPPSPRVGAQRTARFARMLPEFGWRPVVLTMPSEDDAPIPNWTRQFRIERTRGWKTAPGVSKTAARKPSPRNDSNGRGELRRYGGMAIARNIRDLLLETPDNYVSWALPNFRMARRLAREEKVKVVYTSGPPHSAHLIGRYLKQSLQLPWIADFRDPWVRRTWGPKESNPWGQKLLAHFEASCIHHADSVVLNTKYMADEFRAYYGPRYAAKFTTIPNGCDPELAARVRDLLDRQQSCANSHEGTNGVIRMCHPGSLYRRRDPRPIVDAIGILRGKGIPLVFEQIGATAPEFHLETYVAERGLADAVTIDPPVPHEDVLQRMALADLFLLVQPDAPTQVPGKLFEMVLYQRPIVAVTSSGATADIVRQYSLGAVSPGDEPELIARAIESAVARHGDISNINGLRDACRDYDGRTLTRTLSELFIHMLDPRSVLPRPGGIRQESLGR